MGHYIDIKSAIITKLETIDKIEHVYPYEKGDLDGYPSAVISKFELENTWLDTVNNNRMWRFTVRIYQEMNADGVGAEEAETRIDALADLVINAFDEDFTLGGVVDACWIEGGNAWVDRETQMRTLELVITCKKRFSIV